MKVYDFSLGKAGSVTFSVSENGSFVMTAVHNGERYALSFEDCAVINDHRHGRSSKTIRTVNTLCADTKFTADGNTLLAEARVGDDLAVFNRFTVSAENAKVTMETWAETGKKLYDCALVAGRFNVELDGFEKTYGGDIPTQFPAREEPPNYGFRGNLVLEGETRYLEVRGGYVWRFGKLIDAHKNSRFLSDDPTCFNKEHPLRTVYLFEKVQEETAPVFAPDGKETATGEVVGGSLRIPYTAKPDGIGFLCGGKAYPMAAMLVQDVNSKGKTFLDTLSGWDTATVTEHAGATEFLLLDNAKELGIRLIAQPDAKINRIHWSVEAINTSGSKSVLWCTYPRLYRKENVECDLFAALHGGFIDSKFNTGDRFVFGAYPCGLGSTMACYAIYPHGGGEGVYYGIHDGVGSYKDFHAASDGYGMMRINCKFCAPNLYVPANGFCLPGKAVWQQINGDWYDAVEIYREFVEAEADWVPEAGENGRESTPEWMRDIPFWIMDWMPNENPDHEPIPPYVRPEIESDDPDSWYKTAIALRKALDVPIGIHLYNWHGNPFDNDYPHYFPTKNAFVPGLKAMQAAGIRVMPYVNALIWDNKDKGGEDYQFTAIAKPGTVKDEDGQPPRLTYDSKEPDGSPAVLSPMCPSSPIWRRKLQEIVSRLFTEYGVDAIYLDQIAAHTPRQCTDVSHGHPIGGGNWWKEAYRELLRQLRQVMPEGKGFTSEGNAEVYASELDGFLGWAWVTVENYVPAFMRVYGGKAFCFGRNVNSYSKKDTLYWKYNLAQSLVAGEQMGWINADLVYKPDRVAFLKKLAQLRYGERAFFRGARPMRPPVVEAGEDHRFTSGLGMSNPGVLYTPYLCVGVLENGRKRRLIAVNLSAEEISDNVRFVPEEMQLKNFTVSGEGTAQWAGEDALRLQVPGDSVLMLSWEV